MSIERRLNRAGEPRYTARIKHMGRSVAAETFARKADAEAWEREQYRAIQFGEFIAPTQSKKTFAEVIDEFLAAREGQVVPHTWRTDRDNLANTPASWARMPIGTISESDVLNHLTEQLRTKAHSTVSRARTTLSALFQFTVREKMRLRNPVRDVPMPSGEQHQHVHDEINAFTEAELADTLEAQRKLNPAMAEVTEFLSLTGLRWSELRASRIAHLQDLPYPLLVVTRAQSDGYAEKGTKSKRSRRVPLTRRAYEIAKQRAGGRRPNEYLFVSKTGLQLRGNLFRRYVKWTHTSNDHTIHDLRHYAASSWLRAGIPVHQVAAWLGHRNPSTTLRIYAHVLGEEQEMAAISRLDGKSPVHKEYTSDGVDPNLRAAQEIDPGEENVL
ncbi:tyrosine-type recombinase/integrase [Microbacterium sp. B2969]|uniref:Tyrosine-type recombinase/integrase n=1 Tax=Microbacterium alkaliflavum TaxID=3248839 RepID=A0ABW7Q9F6_9MICO